MLTIPFIKKKIGFSYLVWFQNSNAFVQFEEPAWFVFNKIIKQHNTETIANDFSFRYDISPDESMTFVNEISSGVEKLNQVDEPDNRTDQFSEDVNKHYFTPYSNYRYRLGDKTVTFSYESHYFENYIHPLICYLATTEDINESHFFELFSFQDRVIFRYNGEVKGSWTKDESHLVKGLIFMFLINVMYDKTEADWLMTIHASAITNGKKTILFSASPGNGKTTIAALLQSKGYRLISDDFVPISRSSFCAYPFPISMSVKEGAVDLLASLFPVLKQKTVNYIAPDKSVRYLPANPDPDIAKAVLPVHEIIFIQYNPAVDFSLEKLETLKGIKHLLDQAWVSPLKSNVTELLNRIERLSFYQLTYSNNTKTLDAISNLFENDE